MPRVRSGCLMEVVAVRDAIGRSRDAEAGRMYLRAKKFIEKGGYSNVRYDGEFASLIMAGYDDDYIGHKFNIALETVRGHRRRIGKALDSVLGEDFCQLFYHFQENKDEIDRRIRGLEICDVTSYDLLPRELLAVTPEKGVAFSFQLKDCIDELEFLEKHCLASIDFERSTLDMNKLAYLINVVDGVSGSYSDRNEVLAKLMPREV